MQPALAVMMYLDAPMADLELVKLFNCLHFHAAPLTLLHASEHKHQCALCYALKCRRWSAHHRSRAGKGHPEAIE